MRAGDTAGATVSTPGAVCPPAHTWHLSAGLFPSSGFLPHTSLSAWFGDSPGSLWNGEQCDSFSPASGALAGKDQEAEESEVHGERHRSLPDLPAHTWQREDVEERIGMEGAGVVPDPDCSQASTGQERLVRPMSRGGPGEGRGWLWPWATS